MLAAYLFPMPGTSPWTPPPMKSPISFAVSYRTNSMTVHSMMLDSAHSSAIALPLSQND
jgi:hypothetical protein